MTLGLIWAQSADGVIGVGGMMPWHLPEDLARFARLTRGCPVVMGHATWRSLPDGYRPLPGRENIVLSHDASLELPGARVVRGAAEALGLVDGRDAWVIGGAQVFAAVASLADRAEVTDVDVVVSREGTPSPDLDRSWTEVAREPATGWLTSRTGLRYRFRSLLRMPSPEDRPAERSGPGREGTER